jgi:dCTP diphosphatase
MSSTKKRGGDGSTTIEELKSIVEVFVAQRDWAQFHSPKNLAMAIGVEAGELMDLFRWHSDDGSRSFMKEKARRNAAIEELADVVICALAFANRTGVDLSTAVMQKVSKNQKKYPVRKFKGKF